MFSTFYKKNSLYLDGHIILELFFSDYRHALDLLFAIAEVQIALRGFVSLKNE